MAKPAWESQSWRGQAVFLSEMPVRIAASCFQDSLRRPGQIRAWRWKGRWEMPRPSAASSTLLCTLGLPSDAPQGAPKERAEETGNLPEAWGAARCSGKVCVFLSLFLFSLSSPPPPPPAGGLSQGSACFLSGSRWGSETEPVAAEAAAAVTQRLPAARAAHLRARTLPRACGGGCRVCAGRGPAAAGGGGDAPSPCTARREAQPPCSTASRGRGRLPHWQSVSAAASDLGGWCECAVNDCINTLLQRRTRGHSSPQENSPRFKHTHPTSLPLSAAALESSFLSVFSCAAVAASLSWMDSKRFSLVVIWTVGKSSESHGAGPRE
ncbi:PREDICTED: uncharacterized protein LOC102013462 [Chinchilla lanigera]|uniref:uncharacterized protein LOC102013462 n=1 Tax=Chinchilla lanigera TaxID=34839 RepID=UPI0006986BA4|nr:PREDICTED: uncharacterized protein LOC102013462 [Chinchilla lanigera]